MAPMAPRPALEIDDLHVSVDGHEILRGVSLAVDAGSVHALMGPNGSGKSTLANTLLGHPSYEITEGTITFKGEDITEAEPHDRAKAGLFLAFQYPVSIPGVSVANFLRMAINAKREDPIQVKEFRTQLQHAIELLGQVTTQDPQFAPAYATAAEAWARFSWRMIARWITTSPSNG